MTDTTILAILIPIIFGTGVALKLWSGPGKRGKAKLSSLRFAVPYISNLGQFANQRDHNDVSPLIEAEVYMAYGRKKDAQETLALALEKGRITPLEHQLFWSNYGPESNCSEVHQAISIG